jgi:CubicO group peptidase (beta-lactamase class C family)
MRLLSGAVALALAMGAGAMEWAKPEEVALKTPRLDQVTKELADLVKQEQIAGASFVVTRSGKFAYYGAVGYQDKELRIPFKVDSICRLLSQSKPIGAVAILKLIEEGKLSLDTPLGSILPEWLYMRVYLYSTPDGMAITEPATRAITIQDLLTHSSGLSYGYGFGNQTFVDSLYPSQWDVPGMTLDEFSQKLAQAPLLSQPGSKWRYSYSFDVLGVVLAHVTGESPDAWIKRNLLEPLKMYDTGFYVPREKIDRYTTTYTVYNDNPLQFIFRPRIDYVAYRPPTFISLGAGIVSTAPDYARFATMLLNGGTLDGVQVLKPHTVDLLWRNYLTADMLPLVMDGWVSNENTGFGFGVTVAANRPILSVDWAKQEGDKRTGAIGWGGGAQTNFWADPDNDFVVSTPLRHAHPRLAPTGGVW